MPVEINGTNSQQAQRTTNDRGQVKAVKSAVDNDAKQPSAAASGDTLSLTDTAARLKALETQIARLPIVDTERVESVQRQLDAGLFEVDSERVADKVMDLEASLQA